MGKEELASDPRFQEHSVRLQDENALEILKIISAWARTKSADEVEALGKEFGFSATRLHNAKDMNEDPHRRQRGFVKEIDDPLYGYYVEHEFPVMMSKTPPKIKWTVRPVGFDNEFIMAKILGRNQAQIDELYLHGVLGKWKDMQGRRPPSDWDGQAGAIIRR